MNKILKYNPRLAELLSGKVIDTSMKFDVSFMCDTNPMSRIETLLKLTEGKKVIHVGCADHPEVIEGKIANGLHLHTLLLENCERCVGLDTNVEALDKLKSLGMTEVYELASEIPRDDYDVVILGEVLEHTGNPVEFLKGLQT